MAEEGHGELVIDWATLHTAMPYSKWLEFPLGRHSSMHVIGGVHCHITLQPRPAYCDRGNWLASVWPLADRDARLALSLDHQDGWPRYYMDLDRAKAEIEAWLRKRGEWRNA